MHPVGVMRPGPRKSCKGLRDQVMSLNVKFYMKRESNENLSGNAVYYTASSLLVISKNSCNKIHYQKVLTQSPFHIRSGDEPRGQCNFAKKEKNLPCWYRGASPIRNTHLLEP
jgi:hypothetical protein